ncbi:MAG: hypothetical protein R3C11_04250 [Planctomycetaceae bacterium]
MADYLIICSDLFFSSKVAGTAQMLGLKCESVMSGPKAESVLKAMENPQGLVIDLTTPLLNLENLLSDLPEEVKARSIAFGPHVETEKIQQAKDLGCGAVLPRSQFTAQLPELLKQYLVG